MYRPSKSRTSLPRRGVILLVVLVMLTLFAVVGLAFVFYADSEAQSQRTAREATNIKLPEVDPEMAFAVFMNQLIYDAKVNGGELSALRGWSLVRNMYGYNEAGANATPFNGVGRIVGDVITFNYNNNAGGVIQQQVDSYDLINYQVFLDSNGNFVDTFVPAGGGVPLPSMTDAMGHIGDCREPERLGIRDNTGNGIQNNLGAVANLNVFTGGANAGYTYPDYNNLYLAAVKADGTVLVPSFYRPWGPATSATRQSFGQIFPAPPFPFAAANLATSNQNWWQNRWGKYMLLRPRPVDNLTQTQVNAWNTTVPAAQQLPWPLVLEALTAAQQVSLNNLIGTLQAGPASGVALPLSASQYQLFPYPEGKNGDVQNLIGGPSGPDSIWMDLGAPVMTMPDGRKFKMMFAPLITDLDGKINLNTAGNVRGFNYGLTPPPSNPAAPNRGSAFLHASNMGFGGWEVNPQFVLSYQDPTTQAYEWPNLFIGRPLPLGLTQWGRYGSINAGNANQPKSHFAVPLNGATVPGGSGIPPFYAAVDLDGAKVYPGPNIAGGVNDNRTALFTLPNAAGSLTPYRPFPTYPQGYDSNAAVSTDGIDHPLLFNPYRSPDFNAGNNDYLFKASNMAALLRYGDTGAEFLSSDLMTLLPNNFTDFNNPSNAAQRRRLVTTHSWDTMRPTATPWIYNPATAAQYAITGNNQNPTQSGSISFPQLPNTQAPPNQNGRYDPKTGLPIPSPSGSEFINNDWRKATVTRTQAAVLDPTKTFIITPAFSFDSSIRFDLNALSVKNVNLPALNNPNQLPNYPAPGLDGRILYTAANKIQFDNAQNARIDLAAQLYYRLVLATGAFDPYMYNPAAVPAVTPTQQQLYALQWLAQLAVNMVDFIDTDNYITPFNWGSYGNAAFQATYGIQAQFWVYGTELPQVVVNEAYAEWQNAGLPANTYSVSVWAELHNPFDVDPNNFLDPITNAHSVARLQVPQSGALPPYPVYQLWLDAGPAGTPPVGGDTTLSTNYPAPFNNPRGYPYVAAGGATPPGQPASVLTQTVGANPAPCLVNNFTQTGAVDTTIILPANQKFASPTNQGSNDTFYMIGPGPFPSNPAPAPAANTAKLIPPAPTLQSAGMRYQTVSALGPTFITPPIIVLQRLANPALKPNDFIANGVLQDPASPFNPYITVDTMVMTTKMLMPNDGTMPIPPATRNWANYRSYGRQQPYAASNSLLLPQTPFVKTPAPQTNPPVNNGQFPNQPQHTFFQHNVSFQQAGAAAQPNTEITGDWLVNPPSLPANSNYGASQPAFDWLCHLDRPLVSPLELLQVSAFAPWGLTQQFMLGAANNQRFQHRANWFDESQRLFRFFEFVQTHPVTRGTPSNGPTSAAASATAFFNKYPNPTIFYERIPGRINLNTIWDQAILEALCDPSVDPAVPTYFSKTDVDNIFTQMITVRTPNLLAATPALSFSDQPFLSLAGSGYGGPNAQTQYPNPPFANGTGTTNTFFRSASGAPGGAGAGTGVRLFQRFSKDAAGNITDADPTGHPYFKHQLMAKIFNNVTVRSNVFAVWVTVGFFEVTDDTTRPVKLGAELGRSENRQVRHRMFAMIDRTALSYWASTAGAAVAAPGVVTVPLTGAIGITSNGVPALLVPTSTGTATITAGNVALGVAPTSLFVDPGINGLNGAAPSNGPISSPTSETVTVTAVDNVNLTFTAQFNKTHPAGFIITNNTGPPARFDPHANQSLVPYFAIID
jgi:hypothetical protein